ncbi:Hypothetical protein D9617_1g086190 [Elsinoe fawcettii]|nr:Hypothetical protein D9617_1g086190 [Elsinoe fawcettii]
MDNFSFTNLPTFTPPASQWSSSLTPGENTMGGRVTVTQRTAQVQSTSIGQSADDRCSDAERWRRLCDESMSQARREVRQAERDRQGTKRPHIKEEDEPNNKLKLESGEELSLGRTYNWQNKPSEEVARKGAVSPSSYQPEETDEKGIEEDSGDNSEENGVDAEESQPEEQSRQHKPHMVTHSNGVLPTNFTRMQTHIAYGQVSNIRGSHASEEHR